MLVLLDLTSAYKLESCVKLVSRWFVHASPELWGFDLRWLDPVLSSAELVCDKFRLYEWLHE